MDTQGRFRRKHDWTQVQCSFATGLGNPFLISFNEDLDCLQKILFRQLWHVQAACRILHTLCVALRAEGCDGTVGTSISLQSLEDCLAVVQNTRSGRHFNRTERHHLGVMPALIFRPIDAHHMVREHLAESRVL